MKSLNINSALQYKKVHL